MYWFIILFPLFIFPWGPDPYYTFPKTAYLQIFVLCTWLYVFLKRGKLFNKITKWNLQSEKIILILFLLVGISTLCSIDKETSIYGALDRKEGMLTIYSYFSIFLFSSWLLNKQRLDSIIHGMAISSVVVTTYGILQHYSLDFLPRNSIKAKYNLTYSFFDNPNFFGSYLVLIILITISLFINVSNKKLVYFYFLTICLAFIALIFTTTRSGYIGVFFGLVFIFFFIIYKRKNLWRKWFLLMATLLSLLLVINLTENGQYSKRINSLFLDSYNIVSNQSTGHEGTSRFFIWQKSLPLIKEYFWIGSGPDTFEFIFPNTKEVREFTGGARVDKAHNEYLQIALTLGVPTLIIYLLLLLEVLKQALLVIKKAEENEKIILYGLMSAILGYLIQAFFNISVVPVAPLFWALLGITLAKSRIVLNNEKC